jgi:hypothetical protein
MDLDLQHCWLRFAGLDQILDLGNAEVANAGSLDLAIGHLTRQTPNTISNESASDLESASDRYILSVAKHHSFLVLNISHHR